MVPQALPRSAWIVASLLLLAGPALAQDTGGSDLDVTEILPRAPDSARYQVTWAPDDIADEAPSLHYLVELLLGNQTLASHEVAPNRAADTLAVALPAPGDSVGPLLVRVRAVNRGGKASDWVESNRWWLGHQVTAVAEASPLEAAESDTAEGSADSMATMPGDSLAESAEPGEALAEQPAEPADSVSETAEDETPEAEATTRPELRASALNGEGVTLDGVPSEPVWSTVDSITNLTTVEPEEGGVPAGQTVVKVLVTANDIFFAVQCYDSDPRGIVSFSKARDADLTVEDHVLIVLDPFLDGRSGYVFAVNPSGARFDGLVIDLGGDVNSDWDAVWEAKAHQDSRGWSTEIRIPIKSLSFKKGLTEWGFNVQRRVQRLQETSRWFGADQDYDIYQTSRAGKLGDLPAFDFGVGLSVRPSVVLRDNKAAPGAARDRAGDLSLDVTQKIGSNLVASATVNTDFGETEVDARQTNLTRFDVFFPEKRSFFLEGSDIFEFGLGLDEEVLVPFFSRRIGLFGEEENLVQTPVIVGGKVNGRVGNTNIGALAVRNGNVDSLGVPDVTVGAVRVTQNVLEESSVGVLATFGDPRGEGGSWMAGADLTYRTSEFRGENNLVVGIWGLANDRNGLAGEKTAFGGRIEYPNDRWDISLTYARIGEGFQPSLAFVPRTGQLFELGVEFGPRPRWPLVRQMFFASQVHVVATPDNAWESYRWTIRPIDWLFESGDQLRFVIVPQGERLTEPFEISDGVILPTGRHHWSRQEFTAFLAEKRKVSGEATFSFGNFYGGTLNTVEAALAVKPWPAFTLAVGAERNAAKLPEGDFTEELYSGRLEFKFSSDFQATSFLQYDNVSRNLGSNTRLRWTFNPLGDLFVVYNHNLQRTLGARESFKFDSNQLLVKVQYALRF